MDKIQCASCGADDFVIKDEYKVCTYCGTRFAVSSVSVNSTISLNSDVDRLLRKCITDPRNAKKYANLILDIDPSNKEAIKYL